jgi:hypothetical protein
MEGGSQILQRTTFQKATVCMLPRCGKEQEQINDIIITKRRPEAGMNEKRTEDKGVALRIDERITLISLTLNTVGTASNGVDQGLSKLS